MRSLELNLASRPFHNNTLVWVGYALLAAMVVTFTAWNTVTFVDTRQKLADLRNTVGSVESRMSDVDRRERAVEGRIAKHDVRFLATRTSRANQFIHRKAFSWTRLFNVLEKIQPYEVKMSSVRPVFGDPPGGLAMPAAGPGAEGVPVTVDGVAKSVQAFFDFEDALIADPHIDRIEPSRSSRSKTGEILFSLSFLYYAEGLEKKANPEQAEELHKATAPEDPKAPEADEDADADDEPNPADPGGRPLFKSTGTRAAPEPPNDPSSKKKEANR